MKWSAALSAIVLMISVLSTAELAFANPVTEPSVNVKSPINNQNYPTNEIELKVTAFPYPPSEVNFTIRYYVLDDQPSISTNGTAVLSNLSPGSHALKLYGTFSRTSDITNTTYVQNDALVSIVYFSVIYSTQWVIFSIILTLVIVATGSVLYWKRRQIARTLKGEKNVAFKLGMSLLIVGAGFFVPSAWQVANNYLFPYWPPNAVTRNSNFLFTVGLFGISMGLLLIWLGTRKKKQLSLKPEYDTLTSG